MHTPVLLKEVIEGLNIKSEGLYVDATFGEGGHATEIIKRGAKVLGIDADNKQIFNFQLSIINLKVINGNFKDIERIAKENDFFPVDGVVFDLGLSMRQLNEGNKGLSYRKIDEILDMRLNSDTGDSAYDVLNTLSEEALYEIFSKYSEDLNSKTVAKAVIRERVNNKIKTVGKLVEIINRAMPNDKNRSVARIFQALRIYVNNEIDNLKFGLSGALKILKPKGRIAIICFHSLEDRVVKQFVISNNLKQINKKVITGDKQFKFERSAKLRIISK